MDLDQLVSRASVYSKFLGDKLKDRQEQLKKRKEPGATMEFGKQPDNIVGQMRDYQITGMQWLISLYENGLNGILGDEMGLGKTLQTIAFLAHLVQVRIHGPFLIVAPLSTLRNWEQEFSKFAPSIEVAFYHGSIEERKELRSTRLKQKKGKMQCAVVLTSFEIVMNDKKHLQTIPWKYIVVDEGHRLKNLNCKLIKDLKAYKSANRLLLTGTPLQNNLAELWSLLNFLMPEIFSDLQDFENWFEDIKQLQAENAESKISLVATLHEILKPFLLRRVKSDVVLDLLNKKEYILYAPLTFKQKELYDAILRGDIRTLLLKHFANSGVGDENSPVNSASNEQECDPNILPFHLSN